MWTAQFSLKFWRESLLRSLEGFNDGTSEVDVPFDVIGARQFLVAVRTHFRIWRQNILPRRVRRAILWAQSQVTFAGLDFITSWVDFFFFWFRLYFLSSSCSFLWLFFFFGNIWSSVWTNFRVIFSPFNHRCFASYLFVFFVIAIWTLSFASAPATTVTGITRSQIRIAQNVQISSFSHHLVVIAGDPIQGFQTETWKFSSRRNWQEPNSNHFGRWNFRLITTYKLNHFEGQMYYFQPGTMNQLQVS